MKYVGIQTQIWRNNRNTVILLCMFPVFLLGMVLGVIAMLDWLGFFCWDGVCPQGELQATTIHWPIVWGYFKDAVPYTLVITGVWFLIAYFANTSIIRHATHARPLERKENVRVYNIVENLCIAGGIEMPKINIVNDSSLNAFASGIEETASGSKLVLNVRKLRLQLQEVLVRLEIWISFQRNLKPRKGTAHRLVGGDFLVNRRCAHGGGTRCSHLFEHFLFMSGIPLDRRNELRHKVKTLLELYVNVRKRILAVVAELHQPIVHGNAPNYKNNGNCSHKNSFVNALHREYIKKRIIIEKIHFKRL